MSGPNLVMVLFIFYHGENAELKKEALGTLKMLPTNILLAALNSSELHSSIIDLIVRLRYRDVVVMEVALRHRMIGLRTLMFVAEKGSGEVLDILSHNDQVLNKVQALRAAIINNPNADKVMKLRLGWVEPQPESAPEDEPEPVEAIEEPEEIEEEALSKYQQILEMLVAEKIKMALTGDKEWRTLLIREANKMVSTAVLKNPRISEGEVLSVAKSRSSSDELIRIILLNREWVKKYEIKKALVVHPRTPLQKSMRFMTFLTEKDVRELAKSRNVSQAIVNNARRMLMSKKR